MKRRTSSLLAAIALGCACMAATARAHAKEVDQFTDRPALLRYYAGGYRALAHAISPQQLERVLDARMEALLDQLVRKLNALRARSDAEQRALIRSVFQHRYLPELITPYEEWVDHEAQVPLYRVRDKGVYGGAVNYDDTRMTWYIPLSPSLQIGGVLIGTDKLGHFLAQGFQYFEYFVALDAALPEAARYDAVRAYGHVQEYGQLGIGTGGIYSFADLASNWAGMLFFRALFRDVEFLGERHPRYLARDARGQYRRVRAFHWREWVTPDWDEALNPSRVQERAFYLKVARNFWHRDGGVRASICEQYRLDPRAFFGPHAALRPREDYALPELVRALAPYAVDASAICR